MSDYVDVSLRPAVDRIIKAQGNAVQPASSKVELLGDEKNNPLRVMQSVGDQV